MFAARELAEGLPVLWQLEPSHYNEKVRWALDYKRIAHVRRSLLPGVHRIVARRLWGGDTTPVLTLDGRSIGDSTQIIAALEQRWPQPALYPADQAQRARAHELEEFFDKHLGPHIRRAVYGVLLDHPALLLPLFERGQPTASRILLRGAFPALRAGMRREFKIYPAPVQKSRELTALAMDWLEAELQPSGYLVGDSFTVADLTAASLFYPIVRPSQFPYPSVSELPPAGRAFVDHLAGRPGGRWVKEMYLRHRLPQPPPPRVRLGDPAGHGVRPRSRHARVPPGPRAR